MGDSNEVVDFLVRRDDWAASRFATTRLADLAPGQVLFRVDRFAFTSNNVTYAQAGDMLDYWGFFPAEKGWGRIPAMGFADVIRSAHDQVAEGERVFGFFPMSTHLVIRADEVNPAHFVDAAPHRARHAPAYRQYLRSGSDPSYRPEHEDQLMLLRGLFMTSFLVDDFLADHDDFGARAFLVSSASSKTAIALGHLLSGRNAGTVVGLTSPRNVSFVKSLGCYDQVIPYDDVKSLPSDIPAVFVDHSGNGDVVNAVHRHFGDGLTHSAIVGATHWGSSQRDEDLPGAEPTFFFAPAQIQKRAREWGAERLQERLGAAWEGFRAETESWLRAVRTHGRDGVERVYGEVLGGRARPDEGHVLSLWERED